MFATLVGLSVEASTIEPTGGQGVSGGPLLRVESGAEAILHYLVWFWSQLVTILCAISCHFSGIMTDVIGSSVSVSVRDLC